MIDIKINKDYFNVRKVWHDNDDDFYTEIMTLILLLTIMKAMEQPSKCDIRLLNAFYIYKEDITNLENGIKNNRHPMSKTINETKKLIKEMRRKEKNEKNKNNR